MNSNSYYITKNQLQYIVTYMFTRYSSSIFSLKFFADSASKILWQATVQDCSFLIWNWGKKRKEQTHLGWHYKTRHDGHWVKCYPIDKEWGNRCPPYILSFQCDHLEEPLPNFLHCSQSWRVCNTSRSSSHKEAESL